MEIFKKKYKRVLTVLLMAAVLLTTMFVPQGRAYAASGQVPEGIRNFVNRCYDVTFGRRPDEGGFNYWAGQIMDGQLDGSMTVHYFIFSDEYKARGTNNTQFVQDLYTMFMGREPDTDGFNYWKSELSKGSSREKVFAGFANSDEFYNLCKGYGITAG
ncbi:MAG: DUF4214 domain-containing protein, partial [Lachnospiraceae bacterium]|nr:DUF4214 domain-containing protein [Lachnospiraceae bacterium]